MAYILKRTDQGGGYVSKPGSAKSYTRRLNQARKYPTLEAANADRCPENEIALDLERVLDDARR